VKKIVFGILIFLFPIFIYADYSVKNYYIDIIVLDDGSVNITEAFSMDGLYNGYERIINYKGNYEGYYGSKIISVDDVELYDADDIILNEIRSIDFSYDVDKILVNSNLFDKVNHASKGEYGVYTIIKNKDGEIYNIYNPSKMNKDFYINYTLENVVIVHEDVSELALNIFNNLDEKIENLEIYIHIPNNEKLLKVWVHGENSNEVIDNKTIKINSSNINLLDFRVVFDKESILDINKKSNEIVLDKIVELESKFNYDIKDDEYELIKEQTYNKVLKTINSCDKQDYENALLAVNNLKDDDLKTNLLVKLINLESKVERKYIITKLFYTSVMGIIMLGLLIVFYQIYRKDSKVNNINSNIFNYHPILIRYLMKRKIKNNDISIAILNLIINGSITFEKNKNNYKFTKLDNKNLSLSDERLIKLLFNDNSSTTLSKVKKRAEVDNINFLNQYSNWLNACIDDCIMEKFYEDLLFIKTFGISYSIIGIVINALLLDKQTYFSPIITIIVCLISILYFIFVYKKTKKGKQIYDKCLILKKEINSIDIINDIEKFFIYSLTLNCSDKLIRNINIKDNPNISNLMDSYNIIEKNIKESIELANFIKNN